MRRPIALVPLVLLVAAGCGGDGDDSTEAVTVTTTSETAKPLTNGEGGDSTEVVPAATATTETTQPLTKAAYIKQADAICGRINPQSKSLIEEVQRQLTDRDFEAAADTVSEAVEVSRSGIEQLEALPKPAGDETALDQLDDARQRIVAVLTSGEDAIREEAFIRIGGLLLKLQAADQRADGIATGYGFKVCGQG